MAKRKAKSPTKLDPTKTTVLRRAYMAEMQRRFERIARDIQELLVTDDALGLIEPKSAID